MHPALRAILESAGADDHVPSAHAWSEVLAKMSAALEEADSVRDGLEASLAASSAGMQNLLECLTESSEAILSAERDKLHAILTSLGDGLCVFNHKGELELMNPAAEQILGWSLADLGKRDFAATVGLPRRPGAAETVDLLPLDGRISLRRAFTLKTPCRSDDACFVTRDGAEVPVSYAMAPVDNGG